MPDVELDTIDWQRFSVVLLRHMILASDSPSHQLNPEVRLLEILSDRSTKCLEALTDDAQCECLMQRANALIRHSSCSQLLRRYVNSVRASHQCAAGRALAH